ncbi:cytochrome B562 [Pasteurellaceae bacterium LFhippo2]|nr:cytochrome B562 [Pasteurellaceae bacterium LFhippo2]
MKKILFTLVLSLLSVGAVAKGVSMEMFQMNREVNQLIEADSVEAFTKSADSFLEAAKKAQATMPKSLNDDQERFKGYQQAMQDVIDNVEQAKEAATKASLDDAKTIVKQLYQMKKTYHSEYK